MLYQQVFGGSYKKFHITRYHQTGRFLALEAAKPNGIYAKLLMKNRIDRDQIVDTIFNIWYVVISNGLLQKPRLHAVDHQSTTSYACHIGLMSSNAIVVYPV